jgi:Ni/Co efflux regulator RcnB
MKSTSFSKGGTLVLVLATAFAAGQALAKNDKQDQHEKHEKHAKQETGAKHFDERQRTVAHAYYNQQFEKGKCPPGLAKKNNGCVPPGQAKKYTVGQPLQGNVVYHPVPAPLVKQIGQPPAGQRYVRVGNDVLLVSNRSGIVLDALQGLGIR